MYCSSIDRCLSQSVDQLLQSVMRKQPADIECLRLYFTISQCCVLDCTSNWQTVILPFAVNILRLNTSAQKTLKYWFRNADSRFLAKLLSVYKELIKHFVISSFKAGKEALQDEAIVKSLMISLRMMEFMHAINEMKVNSERLPPNRFYVK